MTETKQDNQPDPRSNALVYGLGFLMLAVIVVVVLAGGVLNNDEGSGLSESDVRSIVSEVVGTEMAALIPTSTPIPPTPTLIPVGVAEEDDAFQGPEDAPVVIVEFSDFQCGYCGRWYQETLSQILEEYPTQVKFVYRDFPIFGEESLRAAMATECAEEQGRFWDFHNRLFDRLVENEETPLNDETFISYAAEFEMDVDAFSQCMATDRYYDEVLADYQMAQAYGLRGTPGFVINGRVQSIGAQPFEVFSALIEAELADIGG